MECAACQSTTREDAKFCDACGTPVSVACSACGFQNRPGAQFCAGCGAAIRTATVTAPSADLRAPVPLPERRQITTLFCDLVGSMELSSRLDPEDLNVLTRAYQRRVADVMVWFDGFVARYQGDSVLVYFGWPRASEISAEQALRAAIAVAKAIAASPIQGETLRVRIGIATGLVVVGDRVDAGEGQEQTAIGETPNRAARLQSCAGLGGIVIDEMTRRLVGGLFDICAIGPIYLKGLPGPIKAFEVRGERTDQSRFQALRGEAVSSFVGRGEELGFLLYRWRQARDGAGQVILISGEAGIGKSRLVTELDRRIAGATSASLRFFCEPYATNMPLDAVVRQLKVAAGFGRDHSPAERAGKLHGLLKKRGASDEDAALLAPALGLPMHGLPSPNLSPQRRKERTFEALLRQLERQSAEGPILIVVEDVHWADPTANELLDRLIERATILPVLLVMTVRPDLSTALSDCPAVTVLTLGRLARNDAADLASQLSGDMGLSRPLLDRIIEQADGVPLFLEELTKATLDANSSDGQMSVPPTLQASLLARLDRIPAGRQVAQIGAVIGRRFSRELLAASAGMSTAIIDYGLDQLVAAGLLTFREGADATYVFKHALVRDVAYDSLLRARRAAFHKAVGSALENDPEIVASSPALLGEHFAHAGEIGKALLYLTLAGEAAAASSALTEAERHLSRALDLATDLPDSGQRIPSRAKLLLALGNVRLARDGVGSPRHQATYAEAERACRSIESADPEKAKLLARAIFGVWGSKHYSGRLTEAFQAATELLEVSRRLDDRETRLAAILAHFISCTSLGRHDGAIKTFGLASDAQLLDPTPGAMIKFGVDGRCALQAQLACTQACSGQLESARSNLGLGLSLATRLEHLPTLATVLGFACTFAWIIRDVALMKTASDRLRVIADEHGYEFWSTRTKTADGWIAISNGDIEHGRSVLWDVLTLTRDTQFKYQGVSVRAMLASSYLHTGEPEPALRLLGDALQMCSQTGEIWTVPELHRMRGVALASEPAEAETCLRAAIHTARQQSARLFELRSVVSLARLWHEKGRRAEARAALTPVYSRFTEGFEEIDLIEGRNLLDRLG